MGSSEVRGLERNGCPVAGCVASACKSRFTRKYLHHSCRWHEVLGLCSRPPQLHCFWPGKTSYEALPCERSKHPFASSHVVKCSKAARRQLSPPRRYEAKQALASGSADAKIMPQNHNRRALAKGQTTATQTGKPARSLPQHPGSHKRPHKDRSFGEACMGLMQEHNWLVPGTSLPIMISPLTRRPRKARGKHHLTNLQAKGHKESHARKSTEPRRATLTPC